MLLVIAFAYISEIIIENIKEINKEYGKNLKLSSINYFSISYSVQFTMILTAIVYTIATNCIMHTFIFQQKRE